MVVETPKTKGNGELKGKGIPPSLLASGLSSGAGQEFLLDLLKFKGILNANEISWIRKMSDSHIVVDMEKVRSFPPDRRKAFYDLVAKTSFKEYHENRIKKERLTGVLKSDEGSE